MAKSVNAAFDEFLRDVVNVKPYDSDKGVSSRSFLFDQIKALSDRGFLPKTAPQYNMSFGSFSRKTKIYPLDDIDIIVAFDSSKLKLVDSSRWDKCVIELAEENDSALRSLCDQQSELYTCRQRYLLNSNKVKNRLLSALTNNVPQYSKAELHGRGEAVTLELTSYPWTFDIVPAFYYSNDREAFYLIPNGTGGWKKTNPKVERERVTSLNQRFNGKVLETIRLVKYWNRRGKMPNVVSYVLETMVLDYFSNASHSYTDVMGNTSDFSDVHFRKALEHIKNHIFIRVEDPKKIQGDINCLNGAERYKIYSRATNDCNKCLNAYFAEMTEKDHRKAINIWRDIFGEDFPKYE